jgi:hypothetical protein
MHHRDHRENSKRDTGHQKREDAAGLSKMDAVHRRTGRSQPGQLAAM